MKKALFSLALVSLGLLAVLTVSKAATPFDRPDQSHSRGIISGAGGIMGWKSPSIMDVIRSRHEFSDFQKAVDKAGLSNLLDTKGPFTVFVPTDTGFMRLPSETESKILADSTVSKDVVLNHTTDGRLLVNLREPVMGLRDLTQMAYIMTNEGTRIPVEVSSDVVRVGQAHLLQANIQASNGVIHVVDNVILPPSIQPAGEGTNE